MRSTPPKNTSFLPEDYLQQRAEIKANILHLGLFSLVLFGTVGAFFVTNRQWTGVLEQQAEINRQYSAEQEKIAQLKDLEAQKAAMYEKAEITAALNERVPRSILLAELANRMPEHLTLTQLEVQSKIISDPTPPAGPTGAPQSLSASSNSGVKKDQPKPKPKPPRYEYSITIGGLAATDQDVADYQAALKECPLVDRVDLGSTGEQIVDNTPMRKFRLEAQIRADADAKNIEPMQVPRLRSASSVASGTKRERATGTERATPAPAPASQANGSYNESPYGR